MKWLSENKGERKKTVERKKRESLKVQLVNHRHHHIPNTRLLNGNKQQNVKEFLRNSLKNSINSTTLQEEVPWWLGVSLKNNKLLTLNDIKLLLNFFKVIKNLIVTPPCSPPFFTVAYHRKIISLPNLFIHEIKFNSSDSLRRIYAKWFSITAKCNERKQDAEKIIMVCNETYMPHNISFRSGPLALLAFIYATTVCLIKMNN